MEIEEIDKITEKIIECAMNGQLNHLCSSVFICGFV